jgi:16S rRNA (cytidine1402-2'-O)-methyltransferase
LGVLYVVATPIGNLEDISDRARRILSEVDLIAAEDTRHTGRLLQRLGIDRPQISYHAFNERSRRDRLLTALAEGNVALVSDAGTPGISDPGSELVSSAIEAGHEVVPIPGPSAMAAAVSASGIAPGPLIFLGFLPRKLKERRELLQRSIMTGFALVLFESPNRVGATLTDLEVVAGNRQAVLFRELTKLYEEAVRGTVSSLRNEIENRTIRGECVLVVGGAIEGESGDLDANGLLQSRLRDGLSVREAAREVAELTGERRSDLYRIALKLRESDSDPSTTKATGQT